MFDLILVFFSVIYISSNNFVFTKLFARSGSIVTLLKRHQTGQESQGDQTESLAKLIWVKRKSKATIINHFPDSFLSL